MKKVLAILLVLAMVFTFAACGNKEDASSDTGTSSTITSTEGDETSSSETTNNESTGDTTTSDTTSDSSSEQNTSNPTTSTTSKPTDTSKPTTSTTPSTSKPSTETSKPTETHTHNWGWWSTETEAIIGRTGIEKRTCLDCKETETRSTTKSAVANSFYNHYLQEYFVWFIQGGGNNTSFDTSALFKCGDLLARDNYWDGEPEEIATATISVDVYYKALKEYFVVSDSIINQMKAARSGNAYPVTFDGFTPGPLYGVEGYIHNGGNKYTVYYNVTMGDYVGQVSPIKVELEYNLLNNKPNRYFSIEKVNSIPSNITK